MGKVYGPNCKWCDVSIFQSRHSPGDAEVGGVKLRDRPKVSEAVLREVSLLVAQSCLTLCNPMDCSSPSSSVHGNLQARILEWVAIPFSRGSSQPRDWTQVSSNAGRFFTVWVTREALSEGKAEAIIWGHWSALYLLYLQPLKPSLKVLELMVEVLTFSFQIKDT